MNEVKKTTVHIPIDTLIKIKSIAVKKGTTQNNVINELINKGLENKSKTKKIKARIINDELPKPKTKTKSYQSLKDMGGIIKLDKEVDINEVIDSIHTKKGLY